MDSLAPHMGLCSSQEQDHNPATLSEMLVGFGVSGIRASRDCAKHGGW